MDLKDYAAILTAVVALATFLKAIAEYIKQGATKRAEQFLEMRSRLRENQDHARICELLEHDDLQLRSVPMMEKDNFIGFFEELALLWNSKVFNDQIVYYMFGYYAIACWRSENFWYGLNRDQVLWSHFRDLVSRLEKMEKSFQPSRRSYRL
jgi:hypothetical protein